MGFRHTGFMEPTTLIEAVQYFKDPANCKAYLVPRRWADGVVTCPRCGSTAVTDQPKYNRWQCSVHHDRRQFTLKTGTIFEDSPLGLDKWLPAMWLICSNRNGISSWELHRALGVTQKTAWFMLARIRLAMQDENNGGKQLISNPGNGMACAARRDTQFCPLNTNGGISIADHYVNSLQSFGVDAMARCLNEI